MTYNTLLNSTGQHVWAVLFDSISHFILPTHRSPHFNNFTGTPPNTPCTSKNSSKTWTWSPPNLSKGKEFYNNRVQSLRLAVDTLGSDAEFFFKQGLQILTAHRTNYGPEGPKHLVLLWWEWPQEHWNDLRLGATMNFMDIPVPGIVDNGALDTDALAAAILFVDELIELKVLCLASPDWVVNTFPLFLVMKPHQVGQFRTIADGKAGG